MQRSVTCGNAGAGADWSQTVLPAAMHDVDNNNHAQAMERVETWLRNAELNLCEMSQMHAGDCTLRERSAGLLSAIREAQDFATQIEQQAFRQSAGPFVSPEQELSKKARAGLMRSYHLFCDKLDEMDRTRKAEELLIANDAELARQLSQQQDPTSTDVMRTDIAQSSIRQLENDFEADMDLARALSASEQLSLGRAAEPATAVQPVLAQPAAELAPVLVQATLASRKRSWYSCLFGCCCQRRRRSGSAGALQDNLLRKIPAGSATEF